MPGVIDPDGASSECTRVAMAAAPEARKPDGLAATCSPSAVEPVPQGSGESGEAAGVRLLRISRPPRRDHSFVAVPLPTQRREIPPQQFASRLAVHAEFELAQRHRRLDLVEAPVEREAGCAAVRSQRALLRRGRVQGESERLVNRCAAALRGVTLAHLSERARRTRHHPVASDLALRYRANVVPERRCTGCRPDVRIASEPREAAPTGG